MLFNWVDFVEYHGNLRNSMCFISLICHTQVLRNQKKKRKYNPKWVFSLKVKSFPICVLKVPKPFSSIKFDCHHHFFYSFWVLINWENIMCMCEMIWMWNFIHDIIEFNENKTKKTQRFICELKSFTCKKK